VRSLKRVSAKLSLEVAKRSVLIFIRSISFRNILENRFKHFFTSPKKEMFLWKLFRRNKGIYFHSFSSELYLCMKDVPSLSCGFDSEIGHVPHLPLILLSQGTRNKRKSTQRRNWSYGPLSTNRFTGNLTETSFRKQQEGCSPYWYLVLLAVALSRVIASFTARTYL
jgi:hypothetical protein